MSETKLSASQLAGMIDPLVRDYVDAKIDAAISKLAEQLDTRDRIIADHLTAAAAMRTETTAEIAKLSEIVRMNPDYQITKAKLVRIAKELGL